MILKRIYPWFLYSMFDYILLAMHTAKENKTTYLWSLGSNRRWGRRNFASLYSTTLGLARLVQLIHLASFGMLPLDALDAIVVGVDVNCLTCMDVRPCFDSDLHFAVFGVDSALVPVGVVVYPHPVSLPVVLAIPEPGETLLHEEYKFVPDVEIDFATTRRSLTLFQQLVPKEFRLVAGGIPLGLRDRVAVLILHIDGELGNFVFGRPGRC